MGERLTNSSFGSGFERGFVRSGWVGRVGQQGLSFYAGSLKVLGIRGYGNLILKVVNDAVRIEGQSGGRPVPLMGKLVTSSTVISEMAKRGSFFGLVYFGGLC